MTVGLAIHRGHLGTAELPGGVLRESCRTPLVDRRIAVAPSSAISATPAPATLLPARPVVTRVREAIAARHYSRRTEKA